ncbi:hypothetical protein D3C87_1216960 [compost metagenome]
MKRLVQRLQIPSLQLQLRCLRIESHMFGADRLGDGNHSVLPQQPCQRYLGWRHAVPGSYLFERSVGEHLAALTDRAVGHDRHLVLLAPR